MKKKICLILCFLLMITAFAGCSDNEETGDGNMSNASDSVDNSAVTETYIIETFFANLRYPKMFEDSVRVDITDDEIYTVEFSADELPLFDLQFNGGNGFALGTLKTDQGNVVVRVVSYELDKTNEKYETYAAMQDAVNIIVENLDKEYDFAIDEVLEDTDDSVFEIKTSWATLYYPAKWKDTVTVDVTESSVRFFNNATQLFDVNFGGSEGALIGWYNDTEIRILSYDIIPELFTDSEYTDIRAQQEAVDVVIQYLIEDNNFTLN